MMKVNTYTKERTEEVVDTNVLNDIIISQNEDNIKDDN